MPTAPFGAIRVSPQRIRPSPAISPSSQSYLLLPYYQKYQGCPYHPWLALLQAGVCMSNWTKGFRARGLLPKVTRSTLWLAYRQIIENIVDSIEGLANDQKKWAHLIPKTAKKHPINWSGKGVLTIDIDNDLGILLTGVEKAVLLQGAIEILQGFLCAVCDLLHNLRNNLLTGTEVLVTWIKLCVGCTLRRPHSRLKSRCVRQARWCKNSFSFVLTSAYWWNMH